VYADVAKFVFVYLFEAHASDEWPLGNAVCVKQHKTHEDRIDAAKQLQVQFKAECPVLIDSMLNSFNALFAAWPERFFILSRNHLEHDPSVPRQRFVVSLLGEPSLEDLGFNRRDISRFLDQSLAHKRMAGEAKGAPLLT